MAQRNQGGLHVGRGIRGGSYGPELHTVSCGGLAGRTGSLAGPVPACPCVRAAPGRQVLHVHPISRAPKQIERAINIFMQIFLALGHILAVIYGQ